MWYVPEKGGRGLVKDRLDRGVGISNLRRRREGDCGLPLNERSTVFPSLVCCILGLSGPMLKADAICLDV